MKKSMVSFFASVLLVGILAGCALPSLTPPEGDVQAVAPAAPSPSIEVTVGEMRAFPEKQAYIIDGSEHSFQVFTLSTEEAELAKKKKQDLSAEPEDELLYARLSDIAGALESELIFDNEAGEYFFRWRDGYVTFYPFKTEFEVVSSMAALPAETMPFSSEPNKRNPVSDDLYVPLEAALSALFPAQFYDYLEEKTYLMSASGAWEPDPGYNVPVLQYYTVSRAAGSRYREIERKCVRPEDFGEQLKYLKLNGYETLFFEDLENISEYNRPVILTFDEGYRDNYTTLFPLLKQYNMKAVMFICPANVDADGYLTSKQIKEMSLSGLVSVQPMGMNHRLLAEVQDEVIRAEISDSREYVIKLIGRSPVAFCYTEGIAPYLALDIVREDYVFGVKGENMHCYNTSDDRTQVYRFCVGRDTLLIKVTEFLEKSLGALSAPVTPAPSPQPKKANNPGEENGKGNPTDDIEYSPDEGFAPSGGGEDPSASGGGENPDQSGGGEGPDQSGGGEDPAPSGGGEGPDQSGGGEDPAPSGGGEDPAPSGGGEDPAPSGGGEDPVPSGGDAGAGGYDSSEAPSE